MLVKLAIQQDYLSKGFSPSNLLILSYIGVSLVPKYIFLLSPHYIYG